jgi:hypothetical protein
MVDLGEDNGNDGSLCFFGAWIVKFMIFFHRSSTPFPSIHTPANIIRKQMKGPGPGRGRSNRVVFA